MRYHVGNAVKKIKFNTVMRYRVSKAVNRETEGKVIVKLQYKFINDSCCEYSIDITDPTKSVSTLFFKAT
jgi:hypothetical protein